MTSTIKAMSHFFGNINRPLKFRTAQGSGPTSGRPPPSSTFPAVASSLAAAAGVLLVLAGLLATLLIKTEVLVGNLFVFLWGRSVLPKLLLIRGNIAH